MDVKQTSSVPLCFLLLHLLFSFPSLPPSFDLETKEKTYGNFYLGKSKRRKGGHGQHKKSPACRNGEAERDPTNQTRGKGQTQRTS